MSETAKQMGSSDRRRLPRRVRWLGHLAMGGMLFQVASTAGCEPGWSDLASSLGESVLTGVGNGLASLFEALVLGLIL